MDKVILVSIIVATIVVPTLGARDANPRRGIKRTLVFLFAFNVLYLALVTMAYTRFYVPHSFP